ncbi:DUF115 domain-containing protein [Akkermansiaceae bacterium]|nr:DUF115 domain-containing protein [bacterium]MDB4730509.1 DUF115 domain-containing protein [Akkermansiaceae bacterium]MDB4753082.1 DUF115 domain-containing protein [bacterium]MDC0270362.1 DUF115 domain-containing protein [bacterium]
MLKFYGLTSGYKRIRKLKDRHRGARCFIIGSGPSLRACDLSELSESGEVSFAFNRIFHMFTQTDWRPTYYMSEDEKMLKGSVDEVNKMDLKYKFIPVQAKYYHDVYVDGAIQYKMTYQKSDTRRRLFSSNCAKGINAGSTVVYSAMQMAAYMGFSEIYLLGLDHNFNKSVNNNGEIVIDHSVKDYFSEDYNVDKDDLYIPNTEESTQTYVDAKYYLDQMGVKVFNATRGGKLEVFERADFDRLMSSDEK